jgi:hypothetical protein
MTDAFTRARISPKPRIRLERTRTCTTWVCRGGLSFGFGISPRTAYLNWMANRSMSVFELDRIQKRLGLQNVCK